MRSRTLRITEQAEDDLADIWAFIAQDNPKAASDFIHEIQERFAPLLENPEIGPARDCLSPGLRVHFHRRYAIYYRFTQREVIILRVVQGSRDAYALTGLEES